MTTELVIFALINVLNTLTLGYDLYLMLSGQATITNRVRGDPLMGLPIIVIELFMVAGLAAHLFDPPELR